MIPVNGLRGQLTAWIAHKRSAYGIIKTMDDYPSIIPVKAFATKEMTDQEFADEYVNLAKGVYVTLDALLQSEPVTNKSDEKLKHPETQRELYQHYLRIRDVQVISPAYRVQPQSEHQQSEGQPNADERYAGETGHAPNQAQPAKQQPAQTSRAAAPPMPSMDDERVVPKLSAHAPMVPWNTVSAECLTR